MKIDKIEQIAPDLIRIYGISKVLKSAGFHSSAITFEVNISEILKVIKLKCRKCKERLSGEKESK